MECIIEKTVVYKLTLDESEARWLKQITQNPLFMESPVEESEQNRKMRAKIWDALPVRI